MIVFNFISKLFSFLIEPTNSPEKGSLVCPVYLTDAIEKLIVTDISETKFKR